MILTLRRKPSTDGATLGELFVDGRFECFTLEDVVRHGPKIIHESAIPAGRYKIVITKSQRFGRMLPLLLDVPGFTGIRIHPGNTAADTSGCILVGQGAVNGRLTDSREAMAQVQARIAAALAQGDDVWMRIENAGTAPTVLA